VGARCQVLVELVHVEDIEVKVAGPVAEFVADARDASTDHNGSVEEFYKLHETSGRGANARTGFFVAAWATLRRSLLPIERFATPFAFLVVTGRRAPRCTAM
jgi:hypothetical protein